MLPQNIINILQKYNSEVAEEISNINLATERISNELKSVSCVLMNELITYAKNTGIKNKEKENELLNDSQVLREYIQGIKMIKYQNCVSSTQALEFDKNVYPYVVANENCPFCKEKLIRHKVYYQRKDSNEIRTESVIWHRCPKCNKLFVLDFEANCFKTEHTNVEFNSSHYTKVTFYDTIVISNINKCSSHNHKIVDMIGALPIIKPDGSIEYIDVPITYCETCKRFVMLKYEYDKIKGIPACIINNETRTIQQNGTFKFADKGGSKLYQYGYNVNCADKLTKEQRHTILLTQLLSNNLTKSEIYSTLNTNIHNGLQREGSKKDWNEAVTKWREDKAYVEEIDLQLPYDRINIARLILKFSTMV